MVISKQWNDKILLELHFRKIALETVWKIYVRDCPLNTKDPNIWVFTDSSLKLTKRNNVIKMVWSQEDKQKRKRNRFLHDGKSVEEYLCGVEKTEV